MPTKDRLAREAIYIEQEKCKDNVGCQDQTLAAHGGFSYIEFGGNKHLQVRKITIPGERLNSLQNHLMMFFTGFARTASEIAAHQIKNIPKKQKELKIMYKLAQEAFNVLGRDTGVEQLGKLMHESWQLKRSLSDKVSTPYIDEIYKTARKAGATGGKLLGAGGGGFVLIFAKPERQKAIRQKLKRLLEIPFKFETMGSQIIFYQPNSGLVA